MEANKVTITELNFHAQLSIALHISIGLGGLSCDAVVQVGLNRK